MTIETVAVIITTYNRADIVPKAINSALKACGENDEVIVVDDCSSDNTEQALQDFSGKIKYIRMKENSGLSAARNAGIDASTSSLLAFMDDDDEMEPVNLTLRKNLMHAHPELIYTFSNFSTRYSNGTIARNCLFNWGQEITDWEQIIGPGQPYSSLAELPKEVEDFNVHMGSLYRSQMNDDHVLPSTMVVRRDVAGENVYFDASIRYLESWPYSSKLARIAPVGYLDTSTTWQNQYEVPRLTDAPSLKRFSAHIRTLENQWGKDTEFLETHGQEYQQRIDKERLRRIKEYLAQGFSREARDDIKLVKSSIPAYYKVLANVPSPILRTAMLARLKMKGLR